MSLEKNNAAFSLAKFNFILSAKEKFHFKQFIGTTIRGAFGIILKNEVCFQPPKRRYCEKCLIRNVCSYSYIFETPVIDRPKGTSLQINNAPHPFVFEPPFDIYEPVKQVQINLILVGKGLKYFPYFVHTFEKMGEIGIGKDRERFTIQSITTGYGGERQLLYEPSEKVLDNTYPVYKFSDFKNTGKPANEIIIRFLTPVRIKSRGRLTAEINFPLLIINLLRRLTVLSQFHCDVDPDLDIRKIIALADNVTLINDSTRWLDYERFSSRQQARMKMGGLVGDVRFRGDFTPFTPILKIGELIHIGKGTGFGLGKYKFIEVK